MSPAAKNTTSPNPTHPLPPRIDVHAHFIPPFYATALSKHNLNPPDGIPALPEWNLSSQFSHMSTSNISKSYLSISSPGTHLAPGDHSSARSLTRTCNAYAANLKHSHPDKFGFFASLPLPDVSSSLDEIDRALTDGADGFALLTNAHGVYLGAAALDPVFEKLNAIPGGAVLFLHPTTPCIQHDFNAESHSEPTNALPFGEQYSVPMFEFLFDTARAVINLLASGTVQKYPNLTYIIPHAGGAFPPLFSRILGWSSVIPGGRRLDAADVRKQLKERFYFDLAGWVFDDGAAGGGQLKGLTEGLGVGHENLLYGSDFPFTKEEFVRGFAERMVGGLEGLFGGEEVRRAVYEGNARRLLGEGGRVVEKGGETRVGEENFEALEKVESEM